MTKIFSQMGMKDGDESHGRIRKNHQLNQQKYMMVYF